MLKKTMTYENVDGVEVTKDFYFNMTKAELIKLELSDEVEGMQARIERIQQGDVSGKVIIDTFDDILRQSYGVRTSDGDFVKSPEKFQAFLATEAYSDLLFELSTDAKKASAFIEAIMPSNLREEAKKAVENQQNIFDQEQPKINEAAASKAPELMSEAQLLASLGASDSEIKLGLSDDEIMAMTPRELAGQPREVLIRAYQLKNQK